MSPGAAVSRAVAWTALLLAPTVLSAARALELEITMVGNAGVVLSDGETSLLIDLPYEPGAFGYMTYEPDALSPPGRVLAVITHHHRDHFDRELFLPRSGWTVLGPPSVTEGLPDARVVSADSVRVGAFDVVVVPTPHTDDHGSYRVRWQGRTLHFVGDTEDPSSLASSPPIDVLFVTPWLSCAASRANLGSLASRSVAYHLRPAGGDRICGAVEVLEQGASFTLAGLASSP